MEFAIQRISRAVSFRCDLQEPDFLKQESFTSCVRVQQDCAESGAPWNRNCFRTLSDGCTGKETSLVA